MQTHSHIAIDAIIITSGLCIFLLWMWALVLVFRAFGIKVPTLGHPDRWRELSRMECILFLSALWASRPLFTLASEFILYKRMHTGRPLPSLEDVFTSILTAVILWIWGYIDWERSQAKSAP